MYDGHAQSNALRVAPPREDHHFEEARLHVRRAVSTNVWRRGSVCSSTSSTRGGGRIHIFLAKVRTCDTLARMVYSKDTFALSSARERSHMCVGYRAR
jgi:hypothetical protein